MLKIICNRCKKDLGPGVALWGRDAVGMIHRNAHIQADYLALLERMRQIAEYDDRSVIENDAGPALRDIARAAIKSLV